MDWPEFLRDVGRFERLDTPDRDRFDPEARLFSWRGPLFVDDVGQERPIEWGFRKGQSEEIFDAFINRRYCADIPLWIATNLAPAELRERYGERVHSRLAEHCFWIPVTGPDRRLAS